MPSGWATNFSGSSSIPSKSQDLFFFLIPKKRNLHLTVEVAGSLFCKAESSEAFMVCYLQMVGWNLSLIVLCMVLGVALQVLSPTQVEMLILKVPKRFHQPAMDQAVRCEKYSSCKPYQTVKQDNARSCSFSGRRLFPMHGLGLFCDTSPSFGHGIKTQEIKRMLKHDRKNVLRIHCGFSRYSSWAA